jgi:hypothetical protein
MSRPLVRWLWLAALLALCWLAYRPGLAGGFLFDDYINLDSLGFEPPLASLDAFLRYLTSGGGDPTGRPVAQLSFLLDARTWPAPAAPFLRTNLFIHLGNGLLLALLLRRLGAELGDEEKLRDRAALLGAAIWLLHPLFVSTTLYVVQRQAMLAASFVLLGLLAWLQGRRLLREGRLGAGSAWSFGAIALGTLLAGLSKANGFLLPLLALVLDWVLAAHAPFTDEAARRRARWLRVVLLLVPSLLLVAALLSYGLDARNFAGRGFTLETRLWSEGRALVDYLRLLFAPRALSDGVFNDDFIASASWNSPAGTWLAALFVAAVAGAGFALRRRAPAWSLGLLFFLAAHLVESSVMPLELRFEHRNYLPALLLFWPLARSLYQWQVRLAWRHALALLLVAFLSFTTWQRASLWGQPERLVATWLVTHPGSPRALAASAIALREHGQPRAAVHLLSEAWARTPFDPQVALNFVESRCAANELTPVDLRLLRRSLAGAPGDMLVLRWLDDAIGPAPGFSCRIEAAKVAELVEVVAANPAFGYATARQNLENLRARLALARGEPAAATGHFRASLLADVRPQVAAAQAALLLGAGYDREAMQHLDFYERVADRAARPAFGMARVHDWLLRRQGYWPAVFARLRAQAQAGSAGK